ncbi:exopolyphosphatase [Pyronema domesticum]|uniref:Similar to Exopolyphosphatase acc. no. P38698 n=1 Tax=Pyronema omphalodes (strain CBS 100304) TaxID=1076935 RepID=U4L410_PYROM|nr:exopolyphosphatase [Pyronema domesticum]CCX10469.1 Similar to Exopolyphosphatase; acc. no. P38698 [Pyronema omphalodes CBS 100304]
MSNPLRAFLHSSRARLIAAHQSSSPISIVLGNESADLDSLTSSLLYAYLHPHHPVPFLQIPRSDISLRPDFTHLLQHLSLSPLDLLCSDDEPSFLSFPAEDVSVHLVDHNKLTVSGLRDDKVVSIIDHHDDEGCHLGASPRIIQKSGSCSSLVITELCKTAPPPKEVAELGMASILVDTSNLTKRMEPTDHQAVETLSPLLPDTFDRDSFYASLQSAKQDVDSLSLRDLLRKDYKEWVEPNGKRIGISSVVKGLGHLEGKMVGTCEEGGEQDAFLATVKEWARERRLDVMVVMTAETKDDGKFGREVLLWAGREGGFVNRVKERGEELGLKQWGEGRLDQEGKRYAWRQEKTEMSRKQVAPFLRECLREVGEEAKA